MKKIISGLFFAIWLGMLILSRFQELSRAGGDTGYQIVVMFETERYTESPEYEPFQVRFRLAFVSFSDSTEIPPCKEMFPGRIDLAFEITTQNGTIFELPSSYEYHDGSWSKTWSPYVSMPDDIWVIRISEISAEPIAYFTAIDNLHLMRNQSLLLAVHSDYYNKFPQDMPRLLDIVSKAYEHMVSLTRVRTPICVVLSTLYRCTVASENVGYVSLFLGERSNQSFFSDYMRNDGLILTVFHEMTHSMMTSSDYVFSTKGHEYYPYRYWFDEGEADYVGRIELPRYFGSEAEDFVNRRILENYVTMARGTFDILLENNGTITNTTWRTTGDAGKTLQNGSHPEVEGAGLLLYLEENYRPDFVALFYRHVREFWESLPAEYHTWSDVWTPEVDIIARDTVLVGFLSKATHKDLTSLFLNNLSFQLYNMDDLRSYIDADVYESYISAISLETDLNKDGAVNILDISIVAVAFGTQPGDDNWNEIADLDKNEEINIIDISIVAMDYGKTV